MKSSQFIVISNGRHNHYRFICLAHGIIRANRACIFEGLLGSLDGQLVLPACLGWVR